MDDSTSDILASLERIEARLVSCGDDTTDSASTVGVARSDLWVVEGLRGGDGLGGSVVYAGVVTTPTGGQIEWQYGLPVVEVVSQPWRDRSASLVAIGHPIRLSILELVHGGINRVADIASQPGMGTTGQIYHHVKLLTDAGWLVPAGRGLLNIPSARVVQLLTILLIVDSPN